MRGLSRVGGESATWHVMNRAAQGLRIMSSESDHEQFLSLLRTFAGRAGVKVLAYCVMPNHYHALVRGPGEALTRCFHEVDRLTACAHNDRREQKGHVFQGRFLSFIQHTGGWAARASRYIHLNPIGRLARRPEDYPWSSYRTYIGQRRDESWIEAREILCLFDKDQARARLSYKEFAETGLSNLKRKGEVPEETAVRAAMADELAGAVPGLARALGIGEEEARRLAAHCGRSVLGVPVHTLAGPLGFHSSQVLANGLYRVKLRMSKSAGYRSLVARAEELLGTVL